jgi:hypothetical protein
MHRRRDNDDGLDHCSSRRHARLCHSVAPRGGWTARGGGLTASLCVRKAVPGYHGTQRCTRDYPSTATSHLFFPRSLIRIASPCHTLTSPCRHLRLMRLQLRALSWRWHHPCLCVFMKQANGSNQCHSPSPPGCCATADAAIGLMQVMLGPERLSTSPSRTLRPVFVQEFLFSFFLFSVGHNSSVYLSARKNDVRTMHFFTTRTTSTLTSATSALRGYHIHVVLIGFYYSHNIRVITTLQLQGDVSSSDSTFDLFSGITVCGAPAVIAWGVLEYIS